jgi:Family of unknown function (DUF6356)
MLLRLFTDHPHEVGETYLEHQRRALGFGLQLVAGGVACLVHALVPALCQRTASRTIARLNDRMVLNRVSQGAVRTIPAAAPFHRLR